MSAHPPACEDALAIVSILLLRFAKGSRRSAERTSHQVSILLLRFSSRLAATRLHILVCFNPSLEIPTDMSESVQEQIDESFNPSLEIRVGAGMESKTHEFTYPEFQSFS